MKAELAGELDPTPYAIDTDELLTPALVVYPALVRHNIRRTIGALDGEPARWRPHLKTAKLGSMMSMLVQEGVTAAKCATTLELLAACQAGFRDVLVAFPHTGANARRIAAIARQFPGVRVSATVESPDHLPAWSGAPVDLFIDVNPGMNRTGLPAEDAGALASLARRISEAGLVFRGVHFYDGNSTEPALAERMRLAHARYGALLASLAELARNGIEVPEIITAGTPALPCAIAYAPLWTGPFRHQVSAGTMVYNDASSLAQLPAQYDLRPAVAVVSRVVSRPTPQLVTCDAGHKSVSVDSGVPNCVVLGHPELVASKPSEEHLPLTLSGGADAPALGTPLYLIPRHVCPTVNNFDFAVLAEAGRVLAVEPIRARGHEHTQS